MLREYISFLKALIQNIFGGEKAVTFSDYLGALWLTFLLVINIVLVIVIAYAVLFLPRVAYLKLLRFYGKQLELLAENKDNTVRTEEVQLKAKKLVEQRKRAIQIYWGVFSFVYIPFMIPTVLFLLDIVLSIF